MPGVKVKRETIDGPPISVAPETGQYMPVGLCERGPTTGYVSVRSMAEFEEQCGTQTAYGFLYKDLQRFFRTGGSLAHIARVVGPAATKASVILQDRAGSPTNLMRIDAANAGQWGSQHLTVRVTAGTNSGTYRLWADYDGVNVEDHDNLTTAADAVLAFQDSIYIRPAALSNTTAAPNNQPALGGPTALTGGSDDRGSVLTSHMTAALARFDKDLGAGAVAIPGYPADLVCQALKDHTDGLPRVGPVCPAAGTTKTAAAALADTLDGPDGSGVIMLWPLVQADGIGTPLVPSEGLWAGLRAAAHRNEGPWSIPAADAGEVGSITALEFYVTDDEADTLDAAKVSVWRRMRRNGGNVFQLYGYRSLSTDITSYPMLKTRDLFNWLEVVLEEAFRPGVFKGVDGSRAGQAQARVADILDPLVALGVLVPLRDAKTGAVIGPAYRVDAGPSLNTPTVLGRQMYEVYVGARDSSVSAEIQILLAKVGLQAAA